METALLLAEKKERKKGEGMLGGSEREKERQAVAAPKGSS